MSTLTCLLINSFGGFLYGYNTAIIAPALSLLSKDFNIEDSSSKQSIVTSAIVLGAMFGCLIGGAVVDKLGRKKSALVVGILSTLGILATCFSPNYIALSILRVFAGFGVGFASVVCPIYVSEMAPEARRGLLNTSFQIALTLSIFIAYVVGYLLTNVHYGWRIMFGLGALPGVGLGIQSIVAMPESELWIKKKQPRLLQGEEGETEKQGGIKVLFTHNFRLLMVGVMMSFVQQMTGINTIIYYAPVTFQSAGLKSAALAATMGVGAWNFLTTLIAAAVVDKYGRKKLFIISLIVMTLSTALLGIDYKIFDNGRDTKILGILAIVSLFSFIAAFEAGIGSLFWVIVNEMYPPEVKDAASGIITMLSWAFNLLISLTFLIMIEKMGLSATYFLFTGVGVFGVIFFVILLPETKGIVH